MERFGKCSFRRSLRDTFAQALVAAFSPVRSEVPVQGDVVTSTYMIGQAGRIVPGTSDLRTFRVLCIVSWGLGVLREELGR